MTRVIKSTEGSYSFFNAIAIGLGIELLSGRLDSRQNDQGYKLFLNEFFKQHPAFVPTNWENLKTWLKFYNTPHDLERILAPVLFNLNKKFSDSDTLPALSQNTGLQVKKMNDALFLSLEINSFGDNADKKSKISLVCTNDHWGIKYDDPDPDVEPLIDKDEMSKLNMTMDEAFNKSKKVPAPPGSTPQKTAADQQLVSTTAETTAQSTQTTASSPAGSVTQADASTQGSASATGVGGSKGGKTITKEIDNPAGGDCAFYAFAIGLINSIQEEHREGKSTIFDTWVRFDASINDKRAKILSYNFDKEDKAFLKKLQSSLRTVSYLQRKRELHTALIELKGSLAKNKQEQDEYLEKVSKKEVVYDPNKYIHYLSPLEKISSYLNYLSLYTELETRECYNQLATTEIKKSMETIRNDIGAALIYAHVFGEKTEKQLDMLKRHLLFESFVTMIYGTNDIASINVQAPLPENSVILKAMKGITKDSVWGTHLDLDYLANAFQLNFHCLKNGAPIQPFQDLSDRKVITINNIENFHWTTIVSAPIEQFNASAKASRTYDQGAKQASTSSGTQPTQTETAKQTKPEKGAEQVAGPIGSGVAFEAKVAVGTELDLGKAVFAAALEYIEYSEKHRLSIFHWHGEAGRNRAIVFHREFSQSQSRESLIYYLFNPKHGNTHPHSFRTILLQKLVTSGTESPTLQQVSENFDIYLEKLATTLGVDPKSFSFGKK